MSQPNGYIPVPVIGIPQQGGGDPSMEENAPPARIMVGLKFLEQHNRKIETKIAINDLSIEQIPGLTPTEDEVMARDACYAMLAKYFKGKLSPDEQEKFRRKANHEPQEGRGSGGTLMGCPICVVATGMVHPKCQLCGGEGKIIAYRM